MGTRRSSGTFVAIVVSTPCTSPSSVVGAGGRSHRPVASATGQSRPGGAPPDRGAAQSLPPPLGSAGVLARKPIEWAFVVNFVELPLPPGPARPRLGDSHLGPIRPPVPDELQRLADRRQEAYTEAITYPARTVPSETLLYKAKRQVSDLPLLVEVGRLELPSRGVVPGILRAQPPVELRTRAVRWRRSRVLAS